MTIQELLAEIAQLPERPADIPTAPPIALVARVIRTEGTAF